MKGKNGNDMLTTFLRRRATHKNVSDANPVNALLVMAVIWLLFRNLKEKIWSYKQLIKSCCNHLTTIVRLIGS